MRFFKVSADDESYISDIHVFVSITLFSINRIDIHIKGMGVWPRIGILPDLILLCPSAYLLESVIPL